MQKNQVDTRQVQPPTATPRRQQPQDQQKEPPGAVTSEDFQSCPQGGSIRIKLNGQVKTINRPVTGAALHTLAGEVDGAPVRLRSGGRVIPNDFEQMQISPDQEFTTD